MNFHRVESACHTHLDVNTENVERNCVVVCASAWYDCGLSCLGANKNSNRISTDNMHPFACACTHTLATLGALQLAVCLSASNWSVFSLKRFSREFQRLKCRNNWNETDFSFRFIFCCIVSSFRFCYVFFYQASEDRFSRFPKSFSTKAPKFGFCHQNTLVVVVFCIQFKFEIKNNKNEFNSRKANECICGLFKHELGHRHSNSNQACFGAF